MGSLSYKYEFKLDDSDIQVSETLKILGVTLDRGLTFRMHIAEQLKKGMRQGICPAKVTEIHTPGRNGSTLQSLHPSPFRILWTTSAGDRKS